MMMVALGEIFIDMYKEGAAFRGLLNSFAVLSFKSTSIWNSS